MIFMWPPRVVA